MVIGFQKIFARFLIVILGIAAIFTGGNAGNIKLEIKNEVTTKTEIIQVEVLNYTGKKLITDERFIIEKNENGKWVKLDFDKDYTINDIGVVIRNLEAVTFNINFLDLFGKTLDEGEYRLIKEFRSSIDSSVTFTVRAD